LECPFWPRKALNGLRKGLLSSEQAFTVESLPSKTNFGKKWPFFDEKSPCWSEKSFILGKKSHSMLSFV
jgi:hypothetical protein